VKEIFNTISHQENANQKCNKISSLPSRNGCFLNDKKITNTIKDVGKGNNVGGKQDEVSSKN
jgi:hypothetical protein